MSISAPGEEFLHDEDEPVDAGWVFCQRREAPVAGSGGVCAPEDGVPEDLDGAAFAMRMTGPGGTIPTGNGALAGAALLAGIVFATGGCGVGAVGGPDDEEATEPRATPRTICGNGGGGGGGSARRAACAAICSAASFSICAAWSIACNCSMLNECVIRQNGRMTASRSKVTERCRANSCK